MGLADIVQSIVAVYTRQFPSVNLEYCDAFPDTSNRNLREREIDVGILRYLERHGLDTNYEAGEAVGLSASAASRRIVALESSGAIRGYRAVIDDRLLGNPMTVYIRVTPERQAVTPPCLMDAAKRMISFQFDRMCFTLMLPLDVTAYEAGERWKLLDVRRSAHPDPPRYTLADRQDGAALDGVGIHQNRETAQTHHGTSRFVGTGSDPRPLCDRQPKGGVVTSTQPPLRNFHLSTGHARRVTVSKARSTALIEDYRENRRTA